jgi:hypothetical protein
VISLRIDLLVEVLLHLQTFTTAVDLIQRNLCRQPAAGTLTLPDLSIEKPPALEETSHQPDLH